MTKRLVENPLLWIVSLISILLLASHWAGVVLANVGMIALSQGIIREQNSFSVSTYPLLDVLNNSSGHNALQWLQLGQQLDNSATIEWGLGRAGLAVGDTDLASRSMWQISDRMPKGPLAYQDAILALSLNGQHQKVVSLYEHDVPELYTAVFSDTVALAYLEQARPFVDRREDGSAQEILAKVVRLRPYDLYANLYLYDIARANHNFQSANLHLERLTHFVGASIRPADRRLTEYVVRAIAILRKNGIWDKINVNNAIASLVWSDSESTELEQQLSEWAHEQPAEADARFYLGELYHRRSEWQLAEANYRQALAINPKYDYIYWRMGLVCEAQPDKCPKGQALTWFVDYLANHPTDLLPLKRIAAICKDLEASQSSDEACRQAVEIVSPGDSSHRTAASVLERFVNSNLDDGATVAHLLGVSPESIVFGTELLENNGFETLLQDRPRGWMINDEIVRTGLYRNNIFIGGSDSLDAWAGRIGVRLAGLWREHAGGSSSAPSWYGVWAWDEIGGHLKAITVTPSQWYYVSLAYRTRSTVDTLYLHLNQRTLLNLAATGGEWHSYAALYCQPASPDMLLISPFLYLSMAGDEVWVDDISLRSLTLSTNESRPCTESPLVLPQKAGGP